MPSVGERLRRERESRNTALEEIASTTKIELGYLEALERDQLDALPGRSFGKFYIRAYAEILGFDPAPLIADYDRDGGSVENVPPVDSGREAPRNAWQEALRKSRREARAAREETFERAGTRSPSAEEPEQAQEPVESDNEGSFVAEPPEPDNAATVGAEPLEPDNAATVEAEPLEPNTIATVEALPVEPYNAAAVGAVRRASESSEEPAAPPATFDSDPAPRPKRYGAVLGFSIGFVIVAAWVLLAWLRTSGVTEEAVIAVSTPAVEDASNATPPPAAAIPSPVAAAPASVEQPHEDVRSPPAEPEPAKVTGTAAATEARPGPGGLIVEEFGVGRRVVDRRLEGRSDRFDEGSAVSFSTRVLGGMPGQRIRHVWLREGKRVQTIELELGGPHWRTHSRKTLWGRGSWAVEARETDGRVLARSTFTCVTAGSQRSPSTSP